MDAYASVDNQTRRKMDEMLKTWKEPVPGSIDTRPVFPPDVVRPIENALIKARTTALQVQQESIRGQQALLSGRRQPPPPYRETPTPPGFRPGSQQPPPSYGQHAPPGMNGHQQGPPMQQSYPILSNNVRVLLLLCQKHRANQVHRPLNLNIPPAQHRNQHTPAQIHTNPRQVRTPTNSSSSSSRPA
jgi:hypothetical protein